MRLRQSYLWAVLALLIISIIIFLSTSSGFKWVYQQWIEPNLAPLSITGLQGHWWGPVQADEISLETETEKLVLHKVELDWSPWSLLSGVIDITHVNTATINYRSLASKPQTEPLVIEALPVSINLHKITVNKLVIEGKDTNTVINAINISAESRGERVSINNFSGEVDNIHFLLQGQLSLTNSLDMDLTGQWRTLRDGRELSADLSVVGNRDELLLKHNLKQPISAITEVTLNNWLDELNWHGEISVDQFDSAIIGADQFPFKGNLKFSAEGDLEKATGKIQVNGDAKDFGKLAINADLLASKTELVWKKLSIVTRPDNAEILSTGHLQYGDGLKLVADLRWNNIHYVKDKAVILQSKKGEASVTGDLDNLVWVISFDSSGDDIPAADWSGKGSYSHTQQKLVLDQLLLKTLGGQLHGNGDLSLNDKMAWNFIFNGEKINPGKYWKDWPGNLRMKGKANGTLNEIPETSFQLDNLVGQLRQKPVKAHASLKLQANKLLDADVSLKSGQALLDIKGKYNAKPDFQWTLNVPAMQDLIPHTKGQVKLDGKVAGTLSEPLITVKGYARRLLIEDLSADEIQVNIALSTHQDEPANVTIDGKNIAWRQHDWKTINLQAQGNYKKHSIKLDAQQANNQFLTVIEGSWDKEQWLAVLDKMSFLQKDKATWQLSSPANIRLDSQKVSLSQTCFSNQIESACFDVDYNDKGSHKGTIQLKDLSLDHINAVIPSHVTVNGSLDGVMQWQIRDSKWHVFNSNIKISPGAVNLSESEDLNGKSDLSWRFSGGHITGEIRQNQLQMNWGLDQTADTGISGNIIIPANQFIDKGIAAKLDASIKANIDDLKIVEAFFPQIYKLKGVFYADLDVAGTWNNPSVTGQAGLRNTQFQSPQLGLDIKDIELAFQPQGTQVYKFSAHAQSDSGVIEANGQLNWPDEKGFRLTTAITGDSFKVINIPDAQIWVTPKLDIDIVPGLVNLNGSVHIPKALISPKEINQSVAVSKDAVVTGLEETEDAAWQVNSKIKVSLGKEVSFDGFGLKSQIVGTLDIVDTPHTVTLAQGKLSIIKGTYKAYGQELNIANGDLVYTNNPVDNPALDIRAFRMIDDVKAGVHISGLAQEPQLSLYSKPNMPEADILSYLTIGRPLQQLNESEGQQLANTAATSAGLAGGEYLANTISQRLGLSRLEISTETREQQPWVRVGAYLSPRLYISYGTGLFDEGSSLNIRYKLSNSWTLQGESGENSSGDLLYTIE